MIALFKKLGIGETAAAVIMVVFGVIIWFYPDLVGKLIAIYLVIIGLLKLFSKK